MVTLGAGSLLLALTAWRVAGGVERRRPWRRGLLALLLGPSLLLPLLLALGLVGRLRPGWALALVAGLAAASLALPTRPWRVPVPLHWRLLAPLRRRVPVPLGLRLPVLRRRRVPSAAGVLLAAGSTALVLVVCAALLLPPGGWDEWWYHLPPLAAAVQTGRLQPAPLPLEWRDPAVAAAFYPQRLDYRLSQTGFWAAVYPQGAELWALWSALFLHSDALVDASQAYFALLGAAAVYGLGRALGARRTLALVSAGLWLCTPVVLGQSGVVASDLALAAGALAALAGCVAWARWGDASALLTWGLGTGLALAAKATGLALLVLSLALGLALGCGRSLGPVAWPVIRPVMQPASADPPRWAARLRAALTPATAVLALSLPVGGYWYLRNWLAWGNPVYPVSVRLGALRLPGLGSVEQLFLAANTPPRYHALPGALRLLATWWEAWPESVSYFSRTSGLGPAWTLTAAALLGLALAAALRALRTRRRLHPALPHPAGGRPARWCRRALLLLTGGAALALLLVQPGAWWPRYALALAGSGYALLAPLLQRLSRGPRRATLAALVTAALLGLPPALGDITGYLPAALALPPPQRTIGRLRHGAFAWVDAVPAGATIAHAPMALPYPLYGRSYEHRVVQVDGRSAAEWLRAIRASGATWVCAVGDYGPHPTWARALAPALVPVGVSGGIAVWRVAP